MNDFDQTGYQPVDPTTPVPYDPYVREITTPAPHPYEDAIGIPPPPPPIKHRRGWLPLSVWLPALVLLLVASAVLFLILRYIPVAPGTVVPATFSTPAVQTPSVPTPAPTATPTAQPTMDTNYTADDILQDMQNAGCSCGAQVSKGEYITDFLGETTWIDESQATSRDAWQDPITEQFYNVGLWVYPTTTAAQRAYGNLGIAEDSSGNAMPVIQPEMQIFHGRCIFLISGQTDGTPWTGYQQAIDKYCI